MIVPTIPTLTVGDVSQDGFSIKLTVHQVPDPHAHLPGATQGPTYEVRMDGRPFSPLDARLLAGALTVMAGEAERLQRLPPAPPRPGLPFRPPYNPYSRKEE